MTPEPGTPRAKARFGIAGLDDVLAGGLAHGRVYLLEGNPGTGKTTVALQFLQEGAACGERGLYITLSRIRDRAARGRCLAWLVAATGDRGGRAGAAREPARRRPAAEPPLFLGPRARRDHAPGL
ncbi:ATPase domain-containing protein [Dankookia sp. P2]|uniref:ATPase domain-containing protein n=1 Tax=Dankookia sp. P2 TaxID=3423955 RepID=UPI003D664F02